MKYGLDDKPGPGPLFLYGLQWWVVSLPCVVIMGVVASRLHFPDVAGQTWYLQKMFGLVGVITTLQVLFGHRLPVIIGPAAILLVGLTASLGLDTAAIYSAIMTGGLILTLAAALGLIGRLRTFFTTRIVVVILLLIAVAMSPTILKLVFDSAGDRPSRHLVFALIMVLILLLCNNWLPGVWKSMTVFIGLAGGSLVYFMLAGFPEPGVYSSGAHQPFFQKFTFDPGAVLSFLFCMMAVTINEMGSAESIGQMVRADNMPARVKRGTILTGLGNLAAGAVGIIGPVSYSLSAGVIAATGCASRYTLVPAGLALAACAFSPQAVLWLSYLPGPVMGALLLYLMSAQFASGLVMLLMEKGLTNFSEGITVGLPLMVGLMVAFASPEAFSGFPDMIKPIVANGFVMGTITVVILEHLVFRRSNNR